MTGSNAASKSSNVAVEVLRCICPTHHKVMSTGNHSGQNTERHSGTQGTPYTASPVRDAHSLELPSWPAGLQKTTFQPYIHTNQLLNNTPSISKETMERERSVATWVQPSERCRTHRLYPPTFLLSIKRLFLGTMARLCRVYKDSSTSPNVQFFRQPAPYNKRTPLLWTICFAQFFTCL